jgi:hypothetical protein
MKLFERFRKNPESAKAPTQTTEEQVASRQERKVTKERINAAFLDAVKEDALVWHKKMWGNQRPSEDYKMQSERMEKLKQKIEGSCIKGKVECWDIKDEIPKTKMSDRITVESSNNQACVSFDLANPQTGYMIEGVEGRPGGAYGYGDKIFKKLSEKFPSDILEEVRKEMVVEALKEALESEIKYRHEFQSSGSMEERMKQIEKSAQRESAYRDLLLGKVNPLV